MFHILSMLLLSAQTRALTATAVIESLTFPVGPNQIIELQFGEPRGLNVTDEYGRRCLMEGGQLRPFLRDGETFWQLEGAPNLRGGACLSGMTFKIVNERFVRHDHGLPQILKYYATQSCHVAEGSDLPPPKTNFEAPPVGRTLTDDEAQMVIDCFMKSDAWATVKGLYERYVIKTERKPQPPRREVCTTQILKSRGLTVLCKSGFKRLGDDSVTDDLVVIKEGAPVIRGGGSEARNYIVHPDFNGTIDLRGHSRVYHLPHHKCSSPDVFRGCVNTNP